MRTLLLVCFACLPLFGQSAAQSPPNPKEPTEKEKGQVTINKKETQKLPTDAGPSKTQLDGADHNKETKTKDENGQSDPKPDWWMISLTAGLVLVGAGQVWVLIRQTDILNHGLVETRHATELTRQSLILAQRPRLIVRNVEIDVGSLLQGEPVDFAGTLQLYNSGGSSARVSGVACKLYCFDKLPMKAPFDPPIQPSNIELPPGFYGTRSFPSDFGANDFKTFKGIVEKTTGLYILGELRYSDDLGLPRTKRFCRLFDYEKERFFPIDDPDYETAD